MRDVDVQAARPPADALLLQIQAKMAQTEASIASTAALSAESPDLARAHRATRDMT